MTIRPASASDRELVAALWREFGEERPPPAHRPLELERELGEIDAILARELAFLAEEEGEPVGVALARRKPGHGYISDLYVRPAARGRGIGRALVAAVADALAQEGFSHLTLEVDADNHAARVLYEQLGFREESLELVAEIADLRAGADEPAGPTFGSVHVQTDDEAAVEQAVARYLPRLGQSGGTVVSPPRNGWVAVYDELCDRDPKLLQRLARELSDRTGAVVLALGVEEGAVVRYDLYERGTMVDEYVSVPEYYGPLPPGDVIAAGANPTVAARLTGADPALVRAVARTAASPAELPPAPELLAQVASALGIEGGDHGYQAAATR